MDLGSKLKLLRKLHHLTQPKLADNLNKEFNVNKFDKGRISKWENNKDSPMLSSAKMIADYYNISIDYFMDEASNIDKYRFDNPDWNELNDYFSTLIPKYRKEVLAFAKEKLNEQNERTE